MQFPDLSHQSIHDDVAITDAIESPLARSHDEPPMRSSARDRETRRERALLDVQRLHGRMLSNELAPERRALLSQQCESLWRRSARLALPNPDTPCRDMRMLVCAVELRARNLHRLADASPLSEATPVAVAGVRARHPAGGRLCEAARAPALTAIADVPQPAPLDGDGDDVRDLRRLGAERRAVVGQWILNKLRDGIWE